MPAIIAPPATASPMAEAIGELSGLPDGTALSISITEAAVTLTAGGMRTITLTLPAGVVAVDPGLSDRMRDLADLLADAHAHGEQDPPDPWFLIESLMLAASESGIEVGGR